LSKEADPCDKLLSCHRDLSLLVYRPERKRNTIYYFAILTVIPADKAKIPISAPHPHKYYLAPGGDFLNERFTK
jgi:hypothetical protein